MKMIIHSSISGDQRTCTNLLYSAPPNQTHPDKSGYEDRSALHATRVRFRSGTGSSIVKVDPFPGSLSTSIVPPKDSTICLH